MQHFRANAWLTLLLQSVLVSVSVSVTEHWPSAPSTLPVEADAAVVGGVHDKARVTIATATAITVSLDAAASVRVSTGVGGRAEARSTAATATASCRSSRVRG